MIYFHHSSCISPWDGSRTYPKASQNRLSAVEPKYKDIPAGLLRRMGKAVRIGVGTAMPLLSTDLEGIILGTANGGMEDCIRFLNQIIEFEEGRLTPTNFVQSTTNAIAGQIAMLASNTAYNATHVHRGLAFENALMDACFISDENPEKSVLVGGVEEISTYNFNIDLLAGWYKREPVFTEDLYSSNSNGSIAGEGAAMFVVNQNSEGAKMQLRTIKTLYSEDSTEAEHILSDLSKEYNIQTLISGENGDIRMLPYYEMAESVFSQASVWRYKHLSGEYPTSTAFALWLAMESLEKQQQPLGINVKRGRASFEGGDILIYNAYQGSQHSFMVMSPC